MASYYDGFDVRPFTLWLVVNTVSQNVAANSSVVSYSLRIRKDGNSTPFNNSTSPWGVTIDGQNFSGAVAYNFTSMAIGAYAVIASGTKTVAHDPDGTASISVSANFNDSAGQLDFASLSGTYGLATIPRASVPTLSDNDFDAGSTITIYAHRASASFNHTVTYSFNGATGTIATNSPGIPVANGDYVWTAPTSLLNQIPNTTSGTGTITVTTLNGGGVVGTRTVNFTLRVPSSDRPDFTFASGNVSEGNPIASALAIGAFVQNVSKVTAAMTGVSYSTGATLSSAKITVAGQTISRFSGTTALAISQSGTLPVVASVTDSRGYTVSKTVNITSLAYTLPQITSMTAQRSNISGTPISNGEYVRINLVASTASLVVSSIQKNNMLIKTFSRVRGTTTWVQRGTTVTDTDRTINGFYVVDSTLGLYDDEVAYDFRVEVSDRFNMAPAERSISTAGITMHWASSGGVGVGKFWSQGALDVEGDIYSGGLRLSATGGVSLSSTTHAFQIGPSSGENFVLDQNELQVRNNGAAAIMYLNRSGGNVEIGGSSSIVSVPGHIVAEQNIYVENSIVGRQGSGHLLFVASTDDGSSLSDLQFLNDGTLRTRAGGAGGQYRNFTFAQAWGQVAVASLTAGAGANAVVTFPTSRFTQTPIVVATPVTSSRLSVAIVSPTASGCTIRVDNFTTALSGAAAVNWNAGQATVSAAAG